jgi:2'-hydroxyisoflavone reductase
MDILIIGGTRFLGRALVESALERQHRVTLFNRGQSNPDAFPDVEQIHGDRNTDLEKLAGRKWDAVIDTCGYVPRVVKQSAEYLADKVKRYVFISSISAYQETSEIGADESAPVAILTDPTVEEITNETYGGLKVLCEQAAEAAFPGGAVNIRPGLIVGPYDPSNRFTYWPVRIRKGGDVLVPSSPDYPSQIIDVRDLADFTIKLIEIGATGYYNVTGPDYYLGLGKIFETCKQVSGSDANFLWADDAFLQENEVGAWMEMPLWIPSAEGQALMQVSVQKAINDGLKFRSLEDTIQATLDWYDNTNGDEKTWQAGLAPEKEAAVLDKLRQK